MKKYLVQLEEASGMEINPRKYWVKANNIFEALFKALSEDEWGTNQEIEDLLNGYNVPKEGVKYGDQFDDTLCVEVYDIDSMMYVI